MAPGEHLLHPGAPRRTHRTTPALVVDQVDQEPAELVDVVGGGVQRAPSAAETRVSRRSKATTGRPKAMYSMVLFIVHSSLSGSPGRERLPTSAFDRMAATSSSGIRPVNSTNSPSASRSRSSTSLVEAVTRPDEHEPDVAPAHAVDDDVGQLEDDVDPVLGAHHPDVGHHVAPPRARRRDRVGCA